MARGLQVKRKTASPNNLILIQRQNILDVEWVMVPMPKIFYPCITFDSFVCQMDCREPTLECAQLNVIFCSTKMIDDWSRSHLLGPFTVIVLHRPYLVNLIFKLSVFCLKKKAHLVQTHLNEPVDFSICGHLVNSYSVLFFPLTT